MAELLLVSNPRRRRKKHARRRSRAHRKGRMPAGLRKYWAARRAGKASAPKRRRRRRHHARAAAPRRHRRRTHVARGYTVGTGRIRRRKLNPHRLHRRRRHHNPSLRGMTHQIMPTVKAGAWGAAGALGLDALWGLVVNRVPMIGQYLANPYVGFAGKAVGAVLVGTLGSKVARGKGRELAVGAMTVVTHDFLKSMLTGMLPSVFGAGGAVPLGDLGAYLSGAAPIVGTATIPQSYLPFSGPEPGGPLGAYLSGSSGYADGSSGMFYDDAAGY